MKFNRTILSIILAVIFLSGLFLFFRHIEEGEGVNYYALINKQGLETKQEKNGEITKQDNIKEGEIAAIENKKINMLFFGDLMLDRHVKEKMGDKGIGYVFEKLDKNIFNSKDLVSANLEGAVTDKGEHYNPSFAYDFAFAPMLIDSLKKYSFNFFNLANNHLSDQGERGIIETRRNLDNLKINYSGCQDKETGECSSTVISISGKKIGLAGFSMVYGKFNMAEATSTIQNLRKNNDLVIVNIHWGVEYQHSFNLSQQKVAYNLIDAGADMIIGHHPHVVEGMEIYKKKAIFYSLGNFVFDQYFSPDTQEGLAVGANWESDEINFSLYPLKSKMSQVELMAGEEKSNFLKKFISWSKNINEYSQNIEKGEFVINY